MYGHHQTTAGAAVQTDHVKAISNSAFSQGRLRKEQVISHELLGLFDPRRNSPCRGLRPVADAEKEKHRRLRLRLRGLYRKLPGGKKGIKYQNKYAASEPTPHTYCLSFRAGGLDASPIVILSGAQRSRRIRSPVPCCLLPRAGGVSWRTLCAATGAAGRLPALQRGAPGGRPMAASTSGSF